MGASMESRSRGRDSRAAGTVGAAGRMTCAAVPPSSRARGARPLVPPERPALHPVPGFAARVGKSFRRVRGFATIPAVRSQADTPEVRVSDMHRGTEAERLARLRSGDEAEFAALVDALHGRLVALASTFTHSRSLAEDIAQETWLAVIRGLAGFEARCSLRTWVFSILVRRARTMSAREARANGPAPAPAPADGGPEVEWEPGFGRLGLWEGSPVPWGLEDPAAIQQGRETLEVVRAALAELPAAQRQVVLLRDVEDVSSQEACNILGLSETNQRVLLHRGRARIRRALDRYLREGLRPASRNGAGGTTAAPPARGGPAGPATAGVEDPAPGRGATGGRRA